MIKYSLFFAFFAIVILTGCQRLDPIFMDLQGSYRGTILIDELYLNYNEGVAQQDTLVQTVFADELAEMIIKDNEYVTCGQAGILAIQNDSVQFIFNTAPSSTFSCPNFFGAIPQYKHRLELTADSLKIDLFVEGVGELIGSKNREYFRIKRQLRLERN